MEDKRYLNYKMNKPKYNELNYLISNYFKNTLDNEEKLNKLFEGISKKKSKFRDKKEIKRNIDSPSFGSKKSQSFDYINSYRTPNHKDKNSQKKYCYKKPLNYLINKSVDNIKNRNNYRYINGNDVENSYNEKNISNYNTYNYNTNPSIKTDSYSNRLPSNNTINKNNIHIKSKKFDKNDSIKNIFVKVPTNVTRVKSNKFDGLEDSFDNSLLNNYNYKANSPILQYLNDDYLGYNNTFYNENKNSLKNKLIKNINNNYNIKKNSINESITNYDDETEVKKIYCKTPVKIRELNKLNNIKKYTRKKSKDFYTYKNDKKLVNNILNHPKIKNENYYSNDERNNYLNNNINNNKIINNKIFQNNLYKNYFIVNQQNQFNNLNSSNILKRNNYYTINKPENELAGNNNICKHKKLSSYIIKKNNKEENRKYSAKSYDNTVFKSKIKMLKKKKRPKRKRRNVTYDEIELDKPSATPIKKEDDRGGKLDLRFENKNYFRNIRVSQKKEKFSEEFNHEININSKNIKNNLKKIILIQNWWRNILKNKILRINYKFNKYKMINQGKPTIVNKNKVNLNFKKTYLDKNKYNTLCISKKNVNYIDEIKENKAKYSKKIIIPKSSYITKSIYKDINSKLIFLQRYLKNKILNNQRFFNSVKRKNNINKKQLINKNKFLTFDLNNLNECSVNTLFFEKINNNNKKISNNDNHSLNIIPKINNCFISKYKKKNQKKDNLKIINESKNEYISNNKILASPKTTELLKEQKIDNQILFNIITENKIYQIPKLFNCYFSKLAYQNYKNKAIKLPLNKKYEFITKIRKNKKNLILIVHLQKYIHNYLISKNKKNINCLCKPNIPKIYISKQYKRNLFYYINKIKSIQRKFREHQKNNGNLLIEEILPKKEYNTRNLINNNCSINTMELKSYSSNDNTSQKSKRSNQIRNINEENSISILNKRSVKYKEKLYIFIQIIAQKILKNINQYVFFKIKKSQNDIEENIFFSIIKRIIFLYNSRIKYKNNFNNVFKFIKENLSKNINNLNKYNYILFIPEKQEDNLIQNQFFQNNDNDLANFICFCLKIEHNLIINNNINNLIQYRLKKDILVNHNIFTIYRYMDNFYSELIDKNIFLNNFHKNRELCINGSQCHNNSNLNNNLDNKFNKIKFLPKRKNKTYISSLNFSFDDQIKDNNLNNENDFDLISNVLLYDKIFKRNIYYTITKIDKLNNSMDDSEPDIDIFYKMNEGSQSIVNREMINKVYEDYYKEKLNKLNIFSEKDETKGKKVRHISKLSSSSDIINAPNCDEEDNMFNKIKNYFEEKK